MRQWLTDYVHRVVHQPHPGGPVPSALVQLHVPGQPALFCGAARHADTPTAHSRVRIASVTKLLTAALALKLHAEGRIHLADALLRYLPHLPPLLLRDGRDRTPDIRLHHLLAHRSGLPTYLDEALFDEVRTHPDAPWDVARILDHYLRQGLPRQAPFAPGQGFAYSDTGYVLLGAALQQHTGHSLGRLYREHLFAPLHLSDSALAYDPDRDIAPDFHPWHGELPLDGVNLSFDWAGGGVVSSMHDLAALLDALFAHRIVPQSALHAMRAYHPEPQSWFALGVATRMRYGLGLRELTVAGEVWEGHSGAFGVCAYRHRATGVVLTAALQQAFEVTAPLLGELLAHVSAALRQGRVTE